MTGRPVREAFFRAQNALAFLSRLCPPHESSAEALTESVPFFPAAGLVLGCVITAAAFLASLLFGGSSPNDPTAALICGWLWLLIEAWATRGLHWDGLADVGDALGSGARGERFRAIMKDSRLGAFGALTILFCASGQALCAARHVAQGHWAVLVLAPVWARLGILWLAAQAPAHPASALGTLVSAAACRRLFLYSIALGMLCVAILPACGVSWKCMAVLAAAQLLLTLRLAGTARRNGGVSGDMMGAAAECGQLLFLLSTVPTL